MHQIILIDDDYAFNLIAEITIKKALGTDVKFIKFTDPEEALNFFFETFQNDPDAHNSHVLLDLNMPVLNGWEVLDQLMVLNEKTKSKLRIYIVSSSVQTREMEEANKHPLVSAFIQKPLTIEIAASLLKNF